MAIDIVRKKIEDNNLDNVVPVLLGDGSPEIEDHCADIVYALDMFHQIEDPSHFSPTYIGLQKKTVYFFLKTAINPGKK